MPPPRRWWVSALPIIRWSLFISPRRTSSAPSWIPIFYAFAMGASGAGSLIFGRWYDASGTIVLVPGFVVGALVAPLVFYGGFALALVGVLLWGVSQGIHDAVMNAALSNFRAGSHSRPRLRAFFGPVTELPGSHGSALLGVLYDPFLAGTGGGLGPGAAAGAYPIDAGAERKSRGRLTRPSRHGGIRARLGKPDRRSSRQGTGPFIAAKCRKSIAEHRDAGR